MCCNKLTKNAGNGPSAEKLGTYARSLRKAMVLFFLVATSAMAEALIAEEVANNEITSASSLPTMTNRSWNPIQLCFEACDAHYHRNSQNCGSESSEEQRCRDCGGVWNNQFPIRGFCSTGLGKGPGGTIPIVTPTELDECLTLATNTCYLNALAERRACARACRSIVISN